MPHSPDRDAAATAVADAYDRLTAAVTGLDDRAFLTQTRCAGWCVQDLLFHVLLDAQRALVTLASPTDSAPDRDLVTYWQDWRPGQDGAASLAHARSVRIASSAYARPAGLVAKWRDTTEAAVRAARACRYERVATQGHVLAVPDFLATLAVEAAVHHLDLTADLDDAPAPAVTALALVRRTLDGLLGASAPASWDDTTYALKGTGRLPLDAADRAALGGAADRFPLFG